MADVYGLRRVVSPPGALPQQASRLDPGLPLGDDELLIDVDHLNVDAASFRQLEEEAGGDPERIAARVQEIVRARGKLHNPVTGSGGMLVGRVARIGEGHPAIHELHAGDRIATLVSLTLTPLSIESITAIHPHSERIDIKGQAVLFASGPWARLPDDLPEPVSLAVLDVCGAPAWVKRCTRAEMDVLVIGAGKAGSLCCAQAKKQLWGAGIVAALDRDPRLPERLVQSGLADKFIACDATDALAVLEAARAATGGRLFDLVINCASVPRTELASILACRGGGEVLFFSMATSFSAAALGAEGVGKDVRLTIGNGYAEGHARLALELVRSTPALRAIFEERVTTSTSPS